MKALHKCRIFSPEVQCYQPQRQSKCFELQQAVTHGIAQRLAVDRPQGEMSPKPCEKFEDLDRLIDLLKEKISISSRQKQVQMLTLAPSSRSTAKTAQEFKVSEHKVELDRKLIKERGISGEVKPKLCRPISKDTEM